MKKFFPLFAVFALFLMGAGCATVSDDSTSSDVGDISEFDSFEDFDLTLDLDDFTVDIDVPELLAVGEDTEIIVTIGNAKDEDQVLDSIDIASEYLKGIEITSSSPEYFETYLVETDGTISHTFLETIPANGELQVTFSATAVEAGLFSGDLDICINTGWNCFFGDIATMVQ
ncbi:MAG: hypothetical protein Q8P30_02635 [Candidatus Uhrbacteria bacterium]|nr:hypothetical protein [Candidatus Uhrbacteria bacterium]